jgi:hypothetical protein
VQCDSIVVANVYVQKTYVLVFLQAPCSRTVLEVELVTDHKVDTLTHETLSSLPFAED